MLKLGIHKTFKGKRLYEEGYNLLYIEHRAHGSSEGTYTSFGILERRDVKAWAEFINEKYNFIIIIKFSTQI